MAEHPERLGKHRILRMLGEGGMGRVYLAEHELLKIRRAIKVLPETMVSSSGARDRFVDEAKILARLAHPNIVQIHDMDAEGDCLYIAMDFVSPDGEHSVALDKYLEVRGRRLPPEEAANLFSQACRAIQFAHEQGVIHRDIKPANLLLDRGGVVRVSDFGLAQIAGDEFFTQAMVSQCSMSFGALDSRGLEALLAPPSDPSLGGQASVMASQAVATQRAVGTPHFMPPEVLNQTGSWLPQGDIYSLGVLAYLMVTGHYPVGSYRLPHAMDQTVPAIWDELVERALQHDPKDRFGSVDEMMDLLLLAYPMLDQAGARGGTMRKTAAGEIPESAIRMVREFMTEKKASWDKDQWADLLINFYRYPGHDPVTKDQLLKLTQQEKETWLDREAHRREDEARKSRAAADRQVEAEQARKRALLEKEAQRYREKGDEALQENRWDDALAAWGKVIELLPEDELARASYRRSLGPAITDLCARAQTELDQQRYRHALDLYKQASGLAPHAADIKKRIGDAEDGIQTMLQKEREFELIRKELRTIYQRIALNAEEHAPIAFAKVETEYQLLCADNAVIDNESLAVLSASAKRASQALRSLQEVERLALDRKTDLAKVDEANKRAKSSVIPTVVAAIAALPVGFVFAVILDVLTRPLGEGLHALIVLCSIPGGPCLAYFMARALTRSCMKHNDPEKH